MEIKIKKLRENVTLPTKGSEYSAGYDLYACIDKPIYIAPHDTRKIESGFAAELPHGYFGAIFPRSGLASEEGLRPANCTAIIDEDFRGEWVYPMHNDSNIPRAIHPGDRIAQLVLLPYQELDFVEVDELTDTERGEGGFGSTGR